MPFCPVPHTGRDQVWVAVGIATGFAVAKLLGYYGTSASNTPAGVAVGKRVQHEVYSEPDQQLRVATAKKTGNTRFNNIAAVRAPRTRGWRRCIVRAHTVLGCVKWRVRAYVDSFFSCDDLALTGTTTTPPPHHHPLPCRSLTASLSRGSALLLPEATAALVLQS